MKRNLANLVTMIGLVVCTVLLWPIFMHPDWLWVILALSVVVFASDRYDGYFARRFNAASNFGASMDRLRDKYYVFEMCYYFLVTGNNVSLAIQIPVGLIAIAEVALLAMLILENWYGVNPTTNWWGRKKMGAECISIGICLIGFIVDGYIPAFRWLSVTLVSALFFATLPFAVCSFMGHVGQFRLARA